MARKPKATSAEPTERVIDFDAIRPVSRATRLLDVATVAFSGSARRPLAGLAASTLSQKMAFKAERQSGMGDALVSMVEFKFTASELDGTELCEVAGVLAAVYSVQQAEGGAPLSDEAVELFAEVNGMYHAWPYLRELVASCTARLGLGGVVLPIWSPPSVFPPKGQYVELTSNAAPT